ncbi:ATP-dependent DNA helicase, partial [Micrococcus luteus]|nr:ATP-dependent DNA helicase [Micrococcus luteus]
MAVNNGRLSEEVLQDSDLVLLEKLRLVENQQLKRAAVLLFHSDPECLVTNSYIKMGFFADEHANLIHHDEVHGNLFDQVFNTIELLKLKYFKGMISYDGIVRQERYPVPLEALREAVLNAVVH